MKKLKVVLLESSLELAPGWPRGPLIDKRYHYHRMSSLPQKWKRGRPDIVHTTLILLQDSFLNMEGRLEVYIHTIDNKVYRVREDERVPKHYDAFKEIMAQVLEKGRVPPEGEPLIWLAYDSLSEFVKEHGGLILFWEGGRRAKFVDVAKDALENDLPVGIGMFPRGDFKRSTLRKATRRYSVAEGKPLKAWTIAYKLLCAAESLLGIDV
ncbi:16S rRNA methyltransferase [Ignicoccus pacificus DSM 13166]|uniref:16S rRNA methyltransferase n=1 Tax=Ignicoccus pacificus DSM 13166 TaxID=940294 RepID=A0A977KB24_9CREN|nr:16S rRNA methyltransferase [Ignicoccus pacificus DSM 13166]